MRVPVLATAIVLFILAAPAGAIEPSVSAPAGPSAVQAPTTPAPAPIPASSLAPPASLSEDGALNALVRQQLPVTTTPPAAGDAASEDRAAAAQFYDANRESLLWVGKNGLNTKAAAIIDEIKKAADWGLEPKEFELPSLGPAGEARDEPAKTEVKLTLAVLKYARHARGGRISEPAKQLSSYLDRTPQLRDPKTVLAEIAKADDASTYLRGLHPKHAQFEKLRQRYLELQKAAGVASDVVRIPAGPLLKPGLKHPHVALLRQRLKVPTAAGTDDTLFDPALVDAVKVFQKEKGQNPDGFVGNATRAAFNDIEEPSTAKILANMEMLRWLPDDLGDLYVTVNVPEFMIRVVKGGEVIHEERVITGLPDKQTPIFSDEMELVTFHPRWNVPESIKVRELYPSLARGGTSFRRQGLKLSYNGRMVDPESVDWSSADIRRYDVYQPPGGSNVLGVLKFSFPNKQIGRAHV